MISLTKVKNYCNEDLSNIENYELAVNDTKMWDCHHRLEITEGKKQTKKELIEQGLYYNRPASELIFLSHIEHARLHRSCVNQWKDKHHSEETKLILSAKLKGMKRSEETKRKMRESALKRWKNKKVPGPKSQEPC